MDRKILNQYVKKMTLLATFLFFCMTSNAQGYKSDIPLAAPVIFADGILSTSADYDTHPAFSPSGDTVYFLRCAADISKSTIYFSTKKAGRWTQPEIVAFSGKYFDADPFVSKDGNTLYFTSNRPVKNGDSIKSDTDIWKVEKQQNGSWGQPIHLEPPLNSEQDEHYPILADNGNMYFGSSRRGGKGGSDIYCAKFINGSYAAAENLGHAINSSNNEYEPFIDRDESYLIFMATIPDRLKNADFYISYNQQGTWSKPTKLAAPLNSTAIEWSPKVTQDGRYFFFGSTRNRQPLDEKSKGQSDIYQVGIEALNIKR